MNPVVFTTFKPPATVCNPFGMKLSKASMLRNPERLAGQYRAGLCLGTVATARWLTQPKTLSFVLTGPNGLRLIWLVR